jgi:hypothetical protein
MFRNSSSHSSSSDAGAAARLPLLQQLLLSDSFALLSASDMQGLVTSCPSLQRLDLIRATPYDTPLPAGMLSLLPKLHHMTHLSMTNVDDGAAAQLARLTGLESLSIVWQSSITDKGVQELTALRRLTQLWVHGALSSQLAPGYLLSLQSKVSSVVCLLAVALWYGRPVSHEHGSGAPFLLLMADAWAFANISWSMSADQPRCLNAPHPPLLR